MAKFIHVLPGEFRQADLYRHLRDKKEHGIAFATMLCLTKARSCQCGSIHCPLCGFRKFANRIARIETKPIVGYMARGLM